MCICTHPVQIHFIKIVSTYKEIHVEAAKGFYWGNPAREIKMTSRPDFLNIFYRYFPVVVLQNNYQIGSRSG